jgi:hypothetical protein
MFRAYKPPPRNTSRDTINSASTLAGTVLGGAAGAYFGGPQGAIAGAQMGAGVGGIVGGMAGGGEQQEQRVGSGIGLGMMGAQNYFKDRKQYGDVQTKDGGDAPASTPSGTSVTKALGPIASSLPVSSPMPTEVMAEETNPSKWNYRGRPMMSKPIY